ncbi:hypothetical protein M1310_00185, partial [Candidatus Marsarchaeota archaeon]|nr:hypothetical protein [Candidatus Marsarchaeota archaeon]
SLSSDTCRIGKLLDEIAESLRSAAQEYFKKRIFHFKTSAELKEKYTERLGMVSLPWCGDEACGRKLETEINIPTIGFIDNRKITEPCAACGNDEHSVELFFGRTY